MLTFTYVDHPDFYILCSSKFEIIFVCELRSLPLKTKNIVWIFRYRTYRTNSKSRGSKPNQAPQCRVVLPAGLGRNQSMLGRISLILEKVKSFNVPIVIDADGLWHLTTNPGILKVGSYPEAVLGDVSWSRNSFKLRLWVGPLASVPPPHGSLSILMQLYVDVIQVIRTQAKIKKEPTFQQKLWLL